MTTHPSVPQSSAIAYPLIDHLDGVLIIAYKEDTTELETAIRQEGFAYEVLRQEDNPAYKGFASIYRCMLNHSTAWAKIATAEKPMLVIEADFVPVMGLAQLPMPFDPNQTKAGISWLYTCAPQIYSVSKEGYAEGYSSSAVAYILTPAGGKALAGFVDDITQKYGTGYVNFDSEIDTYLRQRGLKNFVPFRNYGEHGGISNPEHRKNGMSGIHRADVLYGQLAFLPPYAVVEPPLRVPLFQARLMARLKGLARLVTGRFLRPKIVRSSSVPLRLVSFAIRRHLSLHL